jgi:OOP family OmpA-OmpF porin
MRNAPVPPSGEDAVHPNGEAEPSDLATLRTMLVGPERRRLAALQTRLDDPDQRARDVAEVLPHVLLQHAHDPLFARSLTPPLEKALTASVRRDPRPMAEALFPVMGPAIRRAVTAALSGMVDSLNRTLEQSLSWQSIQWRLEARRTGRSFGEIVLLKTLVYRVEQVLMIDRRAGLLIQHVHHHGDTVQDAEMVSGMLTAIRDFVQDSFKVTDADSLESLKVGDLSVWIEPGPFVVLAAVIRGAAPREYRRVLQDAVEEIHLRFGEPLEAFDGDTTPLNDARSVLEGCLETRYRPEAQKPRSRAGWILAGAALTALVIWGGVSYRANTRWDRYLSALAAEPGLVVVETSRAGGRYVVTGLRDPLARDPRTLLSAASLSEDVVDGRWSPYYSLDPPLVLARADAMLRPPAGTTLTLENGVLASSGTSSAEWVAEAARLAPLVPGVTRFDVARALEGVIRHTVEAIESGAILFAKGTASPLGDQRTAIDQLVADVRTLAETAVAADARFRLEVVGHTDADGPPQSNDPLSRARAEAIGAVLRPVAGANVTLETRGVGSAEPVALNRTEVDNQRNRRVVVKLVHASRP